MVWTDPVAVERGTALANEREDSTTCPGQGREAVRARARRWLRRLRNWLEGQGRLMAIPILRWAGDHLPAGAALAVALCLAGILSPLQPMARSRIYAHRAGQCGMRSLGGAFLRGHLATQFREYVMGRKYLRGEVDPREYPLVEKNPELVDELRARGASFLVATGHFSRGASLLLCSPQVTPGQMMVVVADLPQGANGAQDRWNQENFGQILRILTRFRPDTILVRLGDAVGFRRLVRKLRGEGHIALIAVDARWKDTGRKSVVLPFGASLAKAFSTGVARLARLSQCPVAICVPRVDESGTVVIDWRGVIPAADREDVESDARITAMIVEEIERAAWEQPEQYVIDLLQ